MNAYFFFETRLKTSPNSFSYFAGYKLRFTEGRNFNRHRQKFEHDNILIIYSTNQQNGIRLYIDFIHLHYPSQTKREYLILRYLIGYYTCSPSSFESETVKVNVINGKHNIFNISGL